MPFTALGGDWAAFFIQLEHLLIWKTGITIIGIALLWVGIRIPKRFWAPAFNQEPAKMRRQVRTLTAVPLLSALFAQSLSVFWSPFSGPRHTWIVTIFSFFPMIIWFLILNRRKLWGICRAGEKEFTLERSYGWILVGIIMFILFVVILGPGIGSFDGHPYYIR